MNKLINKIFMAFIKKRNSGKMFEELLPLDKSFMYLGNCF